MADKTMNITTTQEKITPARAEEILSEHYDRIAKGEFTQRPIYKTIVAKYAMDMQAGNWSKTPAPIIFDDKGNLCDGQHRLEAVRTSGKTIEFYISSGWPSSVIDSIDRGKTRTVADQLHLHGQHNSTVYASAINCLVRVCYRGEAPPISYAAAVHILDKLDTRQHLDAMMNIASSIKRSGRFIGPLAFYRTVAQKKADEFLRRIVDLELENGTGPALFARYTRDRTINDQGDAVRAICTCIKLWDENEKADHLRGGGYYGVDYLASKNKKLVESIRSLLGMKTSRTILVSNKQQ